ncbi:MAG: hemolysin III [Planctomycetes bacterium RBG_16_64_10]|nr:MAG: hemolysin III [Planctomycetes bacterium RBG_16_64_10]
MPTDLVTLKTVEEELANSVTHGIGLLLSLIGLVGLLILASLHGTAWHVVGCAVFGTSLVLLYLASTLYHAVRSPRLKRILRHLDHVSIYLLIAGTYTPFTLITLRGPWGWTLFGIVWSLALFGIIFKFVFGHRHERWSLGVYLAMGWICVIAAKPIVELVPAGALGLLVAGGLAYTVGTIFWAADKRVKYFHTVWHGFVILGSALHFCAVMLYVVPLA